MPNNKTRPRKPKADKNRLLIDSGLLFQANRMVFMPFGLSLCYETVDGKTNLFVKDMRAEPEKAVFSKEVLASGSEKYERFTLDEGFALMRQRERKLGYTTQNWSRKVFSLK